MKNQITEIPNYTFDIQIDIFFPKRWVSVVRERLTFYCLNQEDLLVNLKKLKHIAGNKPKTCSW